MSEKLSDERLELIARAMASAHWPDTSATMEKTLGMWGDKTQVWRHYLEQARLVEKALRALPDPAPSDGVKELLVACWDVVTHPNYMTVEECKAHGQIPGPGNRLKTILLGLATAERAQEKLVCSVYHSRAIGVACSNCGHPKEAHEKPERASVQKEEG